MVISTKSGLGKIRNLINRKQKELNVYVLDYGEDEKRNVHFLAKRESDGSYVVWTSYRDGNYADFYNGFYETNVKSAVDEFVRRVERQ